MRCFGMLRKQSAVCTPTGLSKGAEGEESPRGARGTCCWWQKAGKPAAKFICRGRFTAQHQTGESLLLSEDQIFFLLVPFLAIAIPLPRSRPRARPLGVFWPLCERLAPTSEQRAAWNPRSDCTHVRGATGTRSREERGVQAEPGGSFLLHLFSLSAALSIDF